MSEQSNQDSLAALSVQVTGLEKDYQELKRTIFSLDSKIESTVNILTNRFDSAIAGLNQKLDTKSQTPWTAIWAGLGVSITILLGFGSAVYAPIVNNQGRLDTIVTGLVNNGIFQRQYDSDQIRVSTLIDSLRKDVNNTVLTTVLRDRYQSDQARTDAQLAEIKSRQLHNEDKYLSASDFKIQHSDLKEFVDSQVKNIQREIDHIKGQ